MLSGHTIVVSIIGEVTFRSTLAVDIPLITEGDQLLTVTEGVYSISVFGSLHATIPDPFVFIRIVPDIWRFPVKT